MLANNATAIQLRVNRKPSLNTSHQLQKNTDSKHKRGKNEIPTTSGLYSTTDNNCIIGMQKVRRNSKVGTPAFKEYLQLRSSRNPLPFPSIQVPLSQSFQ